jgi:hypothetical protein
MLTTILKLALVLAYATNLCELSLAELHVHRDRLNSLVDSASGPHIPPDPKSEAELREVQNEIRRRAGLPPLPAPPRESPRTEPQAYVAPVRSEKDKRKIQIENRKTFLFQKRAYLWSEDGLAPDHPEVMEVDKELEKLSRELEALRTP